MISDFVKDLYDNLLVQVNNLGSENHIDINRVSRTIGNIHKNLHEDDAEYHYKMIGYLIIHHKLITDKINITVIPYDCQIMEGNKGILPTMEDLPVLLQKILSQYVINYSVSLNTH
jgi:hypothetical protein